VVDASARRSTSLLGINKAPVALPLLLLARMTMAEPAVPLKELDVGSYAELAARTNPKKLNLVAIPSLASTLIAAETKKGSPLTRPEVELIRDNATVIASSQAPSDSIQGSRGYADIDIADCWNQWQVLRVNFVK
jgi:hypothetical protein